MARVLKAQDMMQPDQVKAQLLNLQDLAKQAQQIVLDARRQAASVLAAARAEAKTIAGAGESQQEAQSQEAVAAARKEAFAEGHGQGLAQGLEQGATDAMAKAGAELAEAKAALQEIGQGVIQAQAELAQQMQRQTLELAMALTTKIVGQVATADISAAQHNLQKALELAGPGGEAIVRVNPRQLRRLTEHCHELAELLGVGPVRVMADESVSAGGVKVLCRCGEIDATIETQLANVAASLTGVGGLFDGTYRSQESEAQTSEDHATA